MKTDLFENVRNGEVRVLIGSTSKMGAGTNVQKKLIAIHDLDCPWRPSDLEQRAGRIVRQGNTNEKVEIYRYVTEETFDAYLYQLIENKQKFISQVMTSKTLMRKAEDIDEAVLTYSEIKMLATGNPLIKEKMDLDVKVSRLKLLKQNFLNEKYQLEEFSYKRYPEKLSELTQRKERVGKDLENIQAMQSKEGEFEGMKINNTLYIEKDKAGEKLLEAIKKTKNGIVGEYKGFGLITSYDPLMNIHCVKLCGNNSYQVEMGGDIFGNIARIDNVIKNIPKVYSDLINGITELDKQFVIAKTELQKPFEKEEELLKKIQRQKELDSILSLDNKKLQNKEENKKTQKENEVEI